jgi:hypothetical protein
MVLLLRLLPLLPWRVAYLDFVLPDFCADFVLVQVWNFCLICVCTYDRFDSRYTYMYAVICLCLCEPRGGILRFYGRRILWAIGVCCLVS